MKNIILLSLIMAALTCGCDEFLTEYPESEMVVNTTYKTEKDFEQAIAGVYETHQNMYGTNWGWSAKMRGRADEYRVGGNGDAGFSKLQETDGYRGSFLGWTGFYEIISQSNLILQKIDAADFDNEDMRSYIRGEAHMFRAVAYWNLGWMFGGVPIIDKVMTDEEILRIKRSTQDSTFLFAEKEYNEAAKLLPPKWTGNYIGRVNKYAAKGMLARMYIFQSEFSKAKPLLKEIMDNPDYGYADEYVHCFLDSYDNTKERIFEAQFTGGQQGQGQRFSTVMMPQGLEAPDIMPFEGYWEAKIVSLDFVNSFEEGDKRKEVIVVNNLTVRGQVDSVYRCRKWVHYDYQPKDPTDWANNIPILRYTDVALMYAEVLNEEGYVASGEAFDIMNDVRNRAGLPNLNPAIVANKELFKKALIHERKIELSFEWVRWLDIVRWGIGEEVYTHFFAQPENEEGKYSWKDKAELLPIPADELARYNNKNILWQNPGY